MSADAPAADMGVLGLRAADLGILASVAVDLRVGQVVDVPNYVITAVLNEDVFVEDTDADDAE